ncbi:MAG: phosphotransferase, partial [Bacteroides sp.]|nr:phosphotransferase [Bacteroides sp.]
TGLDRPVIDFLESRGEIIRFLENCYGLVDPSVECYDRRGFTSLSVNFGCTGGQHRSVYGAQKMAEHIKAKYPHVKVHLIHREQNIDQSL